MTSPTDPKIVQEVKLISILAHGDAFTAADLAEQIGVSKTTIYRYLDDLKLGGLPIVYHDSCYRLLAEGSHDLAKVMYFTTEEANILFQALANVRDRYVEPFAFTT